MGSTGYHAGASGLVLGDWSFLLADAYFSRSIKAALIAIVVFILYGGLLFTFLDFRAHISWAGHVSGMLAGILAANIVNKTKRGQAKISL
jgi:membrane associated rhomboid family serine protease